MKGTSALRRGLMPALVLSALVATATAAELPRSCRDEVGTAKARTYVAQCIVVSPATHPPCNDSNPCALIIDEIVRGCQMDFAANGGHGVKFCASYLKSSRKPEPR
jgi:hypothetical protein